jgi:alanine dehydrogenase
MLLLNNDDVRAVLDIRSCLDVLEQAYIAQARGEAVTRLRTQTYVPLPGADVSYCLKTMEGALPRTGYMVLRLTSDIVSEAKVDGVLRRDKLPRGPGGTYCGLIIVFSIHNLTPVAILHDGYIQVNRVACTSALATRLLAREDATDLALLGSGGQAWAHLCAIAHVRSLTRIRIFSPSRAHRESFAQRARDELGLDAQEVESAHAAINGAQIIVAATNTSSPIVKGEWLATGAHVVSIVSGDERLARRELDDEVLRRADIVVSHSKEQALKQRDGDLAGAVQNGAVSWDRVYDFCDLVAGKSPRRPSSTAITVFKNNVGLGLQFAAVASNVYESARRKGVGQELPDSWFLQTMKP